MAARGGVVAQVERQAGQKVGELATKQREVRAVLEALAGIKELLNLLPVVPHPWEEFGVWHAQAVVGESLDVLVELLKPHGIDLDTLAAGRHGRTGSLG